MKCIAVVTRAGSGWQAEIRGLESSAMTAAVSLDELAERVWELAVSAVGSEAIAVELVTDGPQRGLELDR